MAETFPKPRVSKSSQSVQLGYELPHRVFSTKAYPILSQNGSTVIIYGHDNGVKIVWRGGKKFKPQQPAAAANMKANGAGSSAVISLDSDDEGDSAKQPFEDKPEFEASEEELNPLHPHPATLQELDLWFGTEVLDLAVLPSTILKADSPSWRGVDVLKHKIVFAASCSDNSVRLVTLPLTPPSPASKARPELRSDFTLANAGKGTWGETVVVLNGHQKPSDGVSVTVDIVGARSDSKAAADPQIVVASHSREVTGLLRLWRVPLKSPQPQVEPFQSISLASPAKSISFNPSLSSQYTSHLLVAEAVGVCRIYDYKLLLKPNEESSENVAAEHGTWLLSLYAGFPSLKNDPQAQQAGAHTGFGRKTVVDAQWVSGGRAIIVLLNDGEWAIWDIEGVGPNAPQGILGRQGIKGGSISEYSLTGYIDGAAKVRPSGPPQITSSKFAPMTPGSRKAANPFNERGSDSRVRGQISVVEVRSSSTTAPSEESILFWLGDTYAVIPNLAKYWAANAQKTAGSGSLFGGPSGARMVKLESVDLQGERCSGIEQIAKSSTNPAGLLSEILILGEHRYVLLVFGKPVGSERPAEKSASRLALVEKSINGGELDVGGIEQALARMENGGSKRKLF
ncbi:hypothetical protein ONS95_006750 [Cadophora gregata]|uniref:uncharacterized protein n=1 Tax=Cadophora gregata TaxID=51156 RepID=UPI0026DC97F0|nr:uncharacterized protein ONS95_006750 [Cadophora gregata]KAK0101586.1 hypothetical protein ONS95_006750 [Cadophora gregata]